MFSFSLSLKFLTLFYAHVCHGCHLCQPCDCHGLHAQLIDLDCSNRGLTSVPSFNKSIHKNIRSLNIASNFITTLESSLFQGMDNLTSLVVNNNNISSIKRDTFNGMVKLRILDLHRNNISSIEGEAIQDCISLQNLDISSNRLTKLNSSVFHNHRELSTLNLSFNFFTEVKGETFLGLRNLKSLILSHNNLVRIEKRSFVNLKELQILKLDWNSIADLDTQFIGGLSLHELNLCGNRFMKFPGFLWHANLSNTSIDMRENDLTCTCDVKHYVHFLRRNIGDFVISLKNCSKTLTSPYCQDHINLALGLNISLSQSSLRGEVPKNDLMNINDGNLETDLSFQFCPKRVRWKASFTKPRTLGKAENAEEERGRRNGVLYVRIDFEVVTVVREVVVYGSSSVNDSRVVVTGEQGDQWCGRCNATTSTKITTNVTVQVCEVSCKNIVYGNSLKVLLFDPISDNSNVCRNNHPWNTINEIVVHGYAKEQYNNWGSWGKWSPCSKTCSGGTSQRHRYCRNPTSLKCVYLGAAMRGGWDTEQRVCGTKDCPEGIWFGIIGGMAGVFVLGLIGVLYKGMEFTIGHQPRPKFNVNSGGGNTGYADEDSRTSTEC